jgi:hypothetical protein
MPSEGIFGKDGRILPFKDRYMDTPSHREKVNEYGRMYTNKLVSDAKAGVKDFELFMELHRRASQRFLKEQTRYDWDNKFDDPQLSNEEVWFIRDYDRKWGIYQKGGLSYMFP